MNKRSIYIETHGCQMNVADSERASSRLRAAGYELTIDAEQADVVILNTCSVRARAAAKVRNRIGEIKHKRENRLFVVGVMGCVAQLEGESLFRSSGDIQFVAGTRATDRLPALLEKALAGEEKVIDLGERQEKEAWDLTPDERSSPYVAFVPIIEGCNKFCSYCIVPFSRGREVSRTAIEIVKEVSQLRDAGYKEVQLIGQNVNSYKPKIEAGLEGVEGATPFSRLLRAVAQTGVERVKYTTSFPRDFHKDIITAMDEHHNLCDWIHLPVQSGSDNVLRRMRRGYRSQDYTDRVEHIKNASRRMALTSDIIVGFPGETEEDFQATLDLVEQCRFDGLYIFKYSERPGTYAAKLIDDVSEAEKTRRFTMLEQLQYRIQSEIYDSYIGKEVSVLVKGKSARSESDLVGHTTCNKVVNFTGATELVGEIVKVTITQAKQNSLYGQINA